MFIPIKTLAFNGKDVIEATCTSYDTKPVKYSDNSTCHELDTGNDYFLCNGVWCKCGADGDKKSLEKVKDYLYEVTYDYLDYAAAFSYFDDTQKTQFGACSAVRNGNWYGRNFDWLYDNSAEFIVKVPHTAEHYASIGVAGGFQKLTNEFVGSGVDDPLYKVVPFRLYDGINEYGVVANNNVVPIDNGVNVAVPNGESEVTMPALMLIRYVLDHFKTAKSAVDYIREHMTIYFPESLHSQGYELHYMIADANNTFIVEFVGNKTVVTDVSDEAESEFAGKSYMTNFLLDKVELNEDGTVWTPETQTEDADAMRTNHITKNGCGLERYNYIVENYDTCGTKDGMRELMNDLKYTRAYSTSETPSAPYWYTEFVGINDKTCATPASEYGGIVEAAGEMFLNRDRNAGDTWQTVHSTVYDIDQKKMYVVAQEDGEELEYSL